MCLPWLRSADGATVQSEKVWRATGHADNPLDVEGVWRKFRDCAQAIELPEAEARRLFDALQRVDTLSGSADIPTIG